MNQEFSIAEAKNKLPAIIHAIERGTPATITRYGTPVAVVISVEQFKAMSRNKPNFWKAVAQFRQGLSDSNLLNEEFSNLRDKSPGREVNF